MAAEPLRPLGVGEVIGRAFGVYRTHFAPIASVGVVFALPVYVLISIVNLALVGDATTATNIDSQVGLIIGATVLVWVLQLGATTISNAAAYRLVASEALGQPGDIGGSVRFALSRFFPLLGVTLLQSVLTVLLALCCLIPGVVFFVGTFVAPGVVLFEREGPGDAISRAWDLVKPRFWAVFGVLVLQWLVTIALGFVLLGAVVALAGIDATSATYQIVNVILQTLIVAVTLPFTAGVAVWLYLDLRHRADGFTLDRFAAIVDLPVDYGPYARPYDGAGPPPPPPGAGGWATPPPPPPPPGQPPGWSPEP